MSLDLILQGTQANLTALLKARGLLDANDNPADGFGYCLWGGSGKFMTVKPTYNGMTQLTPPSYLTGIVIIARLSGELFASDKLDGTGEQWLRSKVAKWIKDNGTLGTFGGMPCYTVSSVRMMRAADVFAWCDTNGMPGHEWAGGNSI